ncbi:MAG: ATP-dependent Clp protease adaptor protein ClpS-domain-containing protein [Monoraphidium minutum]|nr:MAG: ATP-dependent Clp protease adaptor protein ClpS-domain-containing protein [Monoraphidium minutum]
MALSCIRTPLAPALGGVKAVAPRAPMCVAAQRRLATGTSLAPGLRGALVARAERGSSGLLDSDTITTPGKSTEGANKKPPIYKVLLHNDNYNRREYVVKVLMKVVPQITVDDALVVMQEAHESGVALVVACAQDQAETYVEDLRLNGLISSMEPGH